MKKKNILWTIAIALLLLVLPGINVQAASIKMGNKFTKKNITYMVTCISGKKVYVRVTSGKNAKGSVSIPATVTYKNKKCIVDEIGKNAFKANKNITKVTIGKNVNDIYPGAFMNCTKLKYVTFNEDPVIEKNAFKNCTNLTRVTWKKTMDAKVADTAFSGCKKYLYTTFNGITYKMNKDKQTAKVISVKDAKVGKSGDITIPNTVIICNKTYNVTAISKNAKNTNKKVKNIQIECSHQWVGEYKPSNTTKWIEYPVAYGWHCNSCGKLYRDSKSDPCHNDHGGSYDGNANHAEVGYWRDGKTTECYMYTGYVICSKCGLKNQCQHEGYQAALKCQHKNTHAVKMTTYVKPEYKLIDAIYNPNESDYEQIEAGYCNAKVVKNPWHCHVCNADYYSKQDDPCKGRDGLVVTWHENDALSEVVSKGYYKQVDTGNYQCDDCGMILQVYSGKTTYELHEFFNKNGTYRLVTLQTFEVGEKLNQIRESSYTCKDCGMIHKNGRWDSNPFYFEGTRRISAFIETEEDIQYFISTQ